MDILGAHTDGGDLAEGQDTKEDTANKRDNLIVNSLHNSQDLDVAAGGTFDLSTPQGNLDFYLNTGLIRLTGSAASPVTVIVPDGDKSTAVSNVCGQLATIDTVTGATPTVTIGDGSAKTLHVIGIEIEVVADDAVESGALLADGTVVVTGDQDWDDQVLAKAELKDYSETSTAPASSGGTLTLDIHDGNAFDVELTEDTVLTFSNPSPDTKACSFLLVLTQDSTGGWLTTFPGEVIWSGGGTPNPSLDPDAVDIFTFLTIDAGTVWYGFVGGLDFT